MTTRARRTVLVILLVAAAMGFFVHRQQRLGRLAIQCAEASRQRDWRLLEVRARDWLSLRSAPAAWYWLGMALKGQTKYTEAEAAFARVPVEGIRGIDAAIERLDIQFHVFQKPLDAIEQAEQLLEIDPRLGSPRRNLIYYYAMTLQRPQLLREIHRAIEYRADLPEHYVYLLTLEDLSFRDAEEVTARWLEATPDSPELQLIHEIQNLRVARNAARQTPSPELTQRYDDIRRAFLAAHTGSGAQPVVLETLLLLTMDSGDVAEAARLLALVPDDAADDPMFWRYRGWYAMRTGDATQAEESYRQALELHPLGWQSRHEFAHILRAKGEARLAARQQSTAGVGTKLVGESRRLPHAQKVSAEWLTRAAEYASNCGDLQVANGILRRQRPAGE